MKVRVRNTHHGLSCVLTIQRPDGILHPAEALMVRGILCGDDGCQCGGYLGELGRQDFGVDVVLPPCPKYDMGGYAIALTPPVWAPRRRTRSPM